jgi:cyclopropane-fatty-acyl-phospholipid synthase
MVTTPTTPTTPAAGAGQGRAAQASVAFLERLTGHRRDAPFAVRLWDGMTWEATPGQPPRFTLVLRHPGALRAMCWPLNELALGEAYLFDDFDVEGDLEAAVAFGRDLVERRRSVAEKLSLARHLFSLPRARVPHGAARGARLSGTRHSVQRDRAAVTYHYDVSNDFYALWLDERMVYSCAYFASADESLDAAQERKLDYLCRKLRLRPGERLLDVGCGWGGLVIHAARHYGVVAHGITLSRRQADLADARIAEAGLAGRCRVDVMDYREVAAAEPGAAPYDKLVSVGMVEHVGAAKLPAYFAQAWRLLRPGGVFLNHGIGVPGGLPPARGPSFVDRYVFPDGELAPIATTLRAAERSGFEVRDVESLREHYALTLRHWVRRLEARAGEARRATDEQTYRTWRLYMSGAAHGFDTNRLTLYQTLLAKPAGGASRLPLTRRDWYA